MSTLSSHVLDTSSGRPARGLLVRLDVLDGEAWRTLAQAATDDDGRVRHLAPGPLPAGTYRVTFHTGGYLEAAGHPVFYPQVDVVFAVGPGAEHYHVPLLLSPYGYSTYRGELMALMDEAAPELEAVRAANAALAARYPGERTDRQPVHTLYVGAQHFRAETARRAGDEALAALAEYAPDAGALARVAGMWELDGAEAAAVYARVLAKLRREPVEDLRIDFEDGFGARPDAEEDATAAATARELARSIAEGTAPPFHGIRVKSLGEGTARAARTLEVFVGELIAAHGGLPRGFQVTLPKVQAPEQPRLLARWMDRLEARHGLPRGTLRFEIMVETTTAFAGADGRSPLPGFLDASEGRCTGVHLGVYDFTASCSVAAAYQSTMHPMCKLARGLMRLACGGRGVFLSDGANNVLPVGTPEAVHRAWRRSYRHVRAALGDGFYQGWDLHPAQLPIRYAAGYSFFVEGFPTVAERLRAFVDTAARARGPVADEPATGQALLDHVRRAFLCGAVDEEQLASTGLKPEELALPTIGKILAAR